MGKILVIGDSCIDTFIYGTSERMCPDVPVPVFIPEKKISNGGMALNVYENILSIHKDVDIITNDNKINKIRYVESRNNYMFLRVDSEKTELARISNIESVDFNSYDIVVISDYCKGFLTESDIEYICNNHDNVFIDTKKIIGDFCVNAKIIKINNHEYNYNIKVGVDMSKFTHNLLVTLGSDGCRYLNKTYPVADVEIKDMCGAGDTFLSSLVVKYIENRDIEESINFANECSTIIVQHMGVNRIGDFINIK